MTVSWLVEADLEITVDGVPARVTGHGGAVDVLLPQPVRFGWAALRSLPEPVRRRRVRVGPGSEAPLALLRHVLAELSRQRLSVTIRTPRRVLVAAGSGTDSRLGRLVLGTGHLALPALSRALRLLGATAVALTAALLLARRVGRRPAAQGRPRAEVGASRVAGRARG